jgi:hypothetical protein
MSTPSTFNVAPRSGFMLGGVQLKKRMGNVGPFFRRKTPPNPVLRSLGGVTNTVCAKPEVPA